VSVITGTRTAGNGGYALGLSVLVSINSITPKNSVPTACGTGKNSWTFDGNPDLDPVSGSRFRTSLSSSLSPF